MVDFLYELREKGWVAVVGGSDQRKILEQLGEQAIGFFDYIFSENGLVGVKDGAEIHRRQLSSHFPDVDRKKFEKFCFDYIENLPIPIKCSKHVEARSGMWNVSPIGRDCTQEQRIAFETYDYVHGVREKMISVLRPKFAAMNLSYAIGGQISFDCFPKGWDKTYCLQFLSGIDQVHFFGDKTYKGGNDYEIYAHARTVGHSTSGPSHTIQLINNVFREKSSASSTAAVVRRELGVPLVSAVGETAPAGHTMSGPALLMLILGYANYLY